MAPNRTQLVGAAALAEGPTAEVGPRVRAFFGLPVPEAQRQQLGPYLAACAAVAPEFRWTPTANMHLTVRFVGAVDRSVVEGIADRLEALEMPAFDLELGEVETFKRGPLARVVWLQVVTGAQNAGELAARVEAECGRAGLEPEARRFQPHLTLARARARDGSVLPELPSPPDLPPWRTGELVLYSSRVGRAGAVYEPLRTLRLG